MYTFRTLTLFALVWLTPLIIAALVASLFILQLNNRARFLWASVYVIWCSLWLWFWYKMNERTSRPFPQSWDEYLFVGGLWAGPLIGVVIIVSAHAASNREMSQRGFDVELTGPDERH